MLKKILWISAGFVLALAVMAVAGYAYAQTPVPPNQPGTGYGPGMMGGGNGQRGPGMMGGGYGQSTSPAAGADTQGWGGYGMNANAAGPMQDYFEAAFAEALGLTVEEVQQRVANGETHYTIAIAQGIAAEDFETFIIQVRTTALQQMVTEGVITQEQADWMLQRSTAPGSGFGYGNGGGMMGNGHRGGMGGSGYGMGSYGAVGMMNGRSGWMQEYLYPALANAFGLTVEDLQARFDAGQTPWTIAQELGLTTEEFSILMTEAHTTGLAQAVADGVITQEQADAMLARMTTMQQSNFGGDCPMHNAPPNQP